MSIAEQKINFLTAGLSRSSNPDCLTKNRVVITVFAAGAGTISKRWRNSRRAKPISVLVFR